MANNKVILGSETLIDLTDADATADDIVYGKSAYLASGEKGVGTLNSKQASSGGMDLSLVTTGEKYDWNQKGSYSKPSGGIPKTDLASGVQDSLDAADSAYQAPSGGIPSTDMTQAVQTSLGLADTAIQSHQDLSTILGDFATVEASTTASQAYAVGDYLVLNQVLYKVTTAIASGGTIVTSGANANVEQTNVGKEIKNRELWYPTQAIASTSGSAGTLATITDGRITADHVLTKFVAADSSYITSDITCTTSAGQAVITGTSTAATTAEIVLTKKDN